MGSEGGKAVLNKYGREHFVKLGKKGARRFMELYEWKAVPVARWAIVRISDGVIIRVINERPF